MEELFNNKSCNICKAIPLLINDEVNFDDLTNFYDLPNFKMTSIYVARQ